MSNETKKITNVIFKDEQLKAFCVKHHLTDQDILNNLSRFFIQKENNAICVPCDGKNCKMDPYGMQTRLEFQDSLELVYFPCPKIEPDVGKNLETLFFSNKTIYENKELFISNPRAKALKLFDQFVSNYEKNVFQKGLYIHGAFGTGKTFLLWRFAKELSKKQVKVTLVYYPDLVRTIKSYLNTSDFEQLINHLKYCEVLMLDDVGAEMNTAFIRDEILGPILQFRCDANLPVCMSSNYDLNLLKLHFSETKNEIDQVKSDRIIQRIKWLMNEVELDDKNYRL
ncbi:MAG: DnaA/Hda family protein [Bacilli bacterium]|nr:DnaA/Hda family protein [Bacilli bacterium]